MRTHTADLLQQVGPLPVTRRYSDDLGRVLATVEGLTPEYKLSGDELYVRAKVISTKPKLNPYKKGEFESAWIQPLVPVAKKK